MTQLSGIDVSHWQANIDWVQVQEDGKVFAFAKATEGATYVDPQFAVNWSNMKSAGLIRGAYHYLRALEDPIQQVNLFLETVKLDVTDLPPALDVEEKFNEQATNAQFVEGAKIWLQVIQQRTGRIPMIYTAYGTWNSRMNDEFSSYPLWVAHWDVPQPKLPKGFSSYAFWQNTGGPVAGIKGRVDLDQFNGTSDELLAFAASH